MHVYILQGACATDHSQCFHCLRQPTALVAQAFLTFLGNSTCAVAAYRIFKSMQPSTGSP